MWLNREVLQIPSNATKLSHICRCLSVAVSICLLFTSISITNAVPTADTSGTGGMLLYYRSARETVLTNEDLSKDINETASVQPQGTCLLDGISIAETTVFCEKKVGCRAIQKTGHCCPDYKCDCEKDGKTYSNGDKLVDPDTPCTVCYCQGGEILCSSVTCYKRDDCEPKFISGRCCPEYDNCPVSITNNQNKSIVNKTEIATQPLKPDMIHNPLGIKIKEITKPEEIRITNPKPNPSSPVNSERSTFRPIIVSASTESPFSNGIGKMATNNGTKLIKVVGTQTVEETKFNIKREFAPTTESTILEAVGSVSSTISSSSASSPSSLEINNKNLISRQPSTTDFEQSAASAFDLDPESAGSDNIYHIILTTDGPSTIGESSSFYHINNRLSSTEGYGDDHSAVIYADFDNITKNDDDGSQKVFAQNQTTIVITEMISSSSSSFAPRIDDEMMSSTESNPSSTSKPFVKPVATDTGHHHIDDDDSTPVESNPAYPTIVDEDLSNYPRDMVMPLSEPDDYAESETWAKSYSSEKDESRSSSDFSKSKHLIDSFSVNGQRTSSDSDSTSSTTAAAEPEMSTENSSSSSSTEQSGSSTTEFFSTHSTNSSVNGDENPSSESSEEFSEALELDVSSGSGSGGSSSEVFFNENNVSHSPSLRRRDREPTTPKIAQEMYDIDELGSSDNGQVESPAYDPKEDAESLKLDDDVKDGANESPTVGAKGNVLEVKAYPGQDKALDEPFDSIIIGRNQRVILHPVF